MLFGLNMDIYKILPVNLHIHSEHSKTWKKIKSVSRLFQRNISSREKTRKLVNLFCYKTTVTIKIILTNAKLLLSFINIHLLQSVLPFVNPILIHSLFSKIYSHQGDLIFWYCFSIYVPNIFLKRLVLTWKNIFKWNTASKKPWKIHTRSNYSNERRCCI